MQEYCTIKEKILNFEKDIKINYFILNNIFWFDFIFQILREKNDSYIDFLKIFNESKDLRLELIASLFYLQLKMIQKNLFIDFEFKYILISKKNSKIQLFIDPQIKIINLFNYEKTLLHKIYNLKKLKINEEITNDFILKNTNKLFQLKNNNFKNNFDTNFFIKSYCYDNLII